jgi:hypothetical protein
VVGFVTGKVDLAVAALTAVAALVTVLEALLFWWFK